MKITEITIEEFNRKFPPETRVHFNDAEYPDSYSLIAVEAAERAGQCEILIINKALEQDIDNSFRPVWVYVPLNLVPKDSPQVRGYCDNQFTISILELLDLPNDDEALTIWPLWLICDGHFTRGDRGRLTKIDWGELFDDTIWAFIDNTPTPSVVRLDRNNLPVSGILHDGISYFRMSHIAIPFLVKP